MLAPCKEEVIFAQDSIGEMEGEVQLWPVGQEGKIFICEGPFK